MRPLLEIHPIRCLLPRRLQRAGSIIRHDKKKSRPNAGRRLTYPSLMGNTEFAEATLACNIDGVDFFWREGTIEDV